jgi:hypothetical protein
MMTPKILKTLNVLDRFPRRSLTNTMSISITLTSMMEVNKCKTVNSNLTIVQHKKIIILSLRKVSKCLRILIQVNIIILWLNPNSMIHWVYHSTTTDLTFTIKIGLSRTKIMMMMSPTKGICLFNFRIGPRKSRISERNEISRRKKEIQRNDHL